MAHPKAVPVALTVAGSDSGGGAGIQADLKTFARFFKERQRPPLVVDPVMIATSGAQLLDSPALRAVQSQLLPCATLVTPNLYETAVLAGRRVESIEGMRSAAREIKARYGCAALVKGGHLRGVREAIDIYYDGETELLLSAPFIKGARAQGTGCTYAAAITAYLALGYGLSRGVERAKHYITGAIAGRVTAGGHAVLDHMRGRNK